MVVTFILLGEAAMKASYDRDSDALLIRVAKGKVDHAEENGDIYCAFHEARETFVG